MGNDTISSSVADAVIPFVDPHSHDRLEERNSVFYNCRTGESVARIVDGIPRFVDPTQNYAGSFAFQWKHWHDTLSDKRNVDLSGKKRAVILRRTRFDQYKTDGATILECGMGGGDDTEVLLDLRFRQVHSFDLSTAVERAAKYLDDRPRSLLLAPARQHGASA